MYVQLTSWVCGEGSRTSFFCWSSGLPGGLSSMRKTSELEHLCGAASYTPAQETRSCESQVKTKCKHEVLRGPQCRQCIRENIQSIDSGLGGRKMCSAYQISHFCFYYGEGTEDARPLPVARLEAPLQAHPAWRDRGYAQLTQN